MILQLKDTKKPVIIDIDTQKDLFLAGGKSCIRNHRRILARIRRIMAWVRFNHIVVISTCEIYPNNNSQFRCIINTEGQKKISYTLLNDRLSFIVDNSTDLPRDLLFAHRQIILQKRDPDPFEEPRIDRLLTEMRAKEFILIGALLEGAVKLTALGLLQRGKKVTVIVDAIGAINRRKAKLALLKLENKGAKLIEANKLVGDSHLRGVTERNCLDCQRILATK